MWCGGRNKESFFSACFSLPIQVRIAITFLEGLTKYIEIQT